MEQPLEFVQRGKLTRFDEGDTAEDVVELLVADQKQLLELGVAHASAQTMCTMHRQGRNVTPAHALNPPETINNTNACVYRHRRNCPLATVYACQIVLLDISATFPKVEAPNV